MRSMTGEEWMVASQLYAFLGNSLLSPMSRTESVGLDPAFWRELGGLLDGALADSAESLASWAERASADAARFETVQRVSVEFTKLFVGPPKPAAAPWESANGPVDSHVGFGEATFAKRERFRALGVELCNEDNQDEDTVGVELVY
ncbi:molecular chaperone TorD family protein, partial [Senegalimassilia anaerobia]|uniref:molecular chaperone TorD family protein n=1 Tax=Senegalimassilia anaerobia TaxID=1473216 RepID=UPI00248E2395